MEGWKPRRTATSDRGPRYWKIAPWVIIAVAAAVLIAGFRHQAAQAAVLRADPDSILDDPAMRATALAGGKPVFEQHCASCHGVSGRGDQKRGIPDLTDGEHLYGAGKVFEIEQITRYGIRAYDKRGQTLASMPAYASAVPYAAEPLPPQTPAQIEALTQFLLSFTGRATDPDAARNGRAQFDAAGCWDCHGHSAEGDAAVGAPTLTDDIWLYGGSHDAIYRSIAYGRAGYSPAFARRLSASDLRDVALYAASLAAPVPSRKTP